MEPDKKTSAQEPSSEGSIEKKSELIEQTNQLPSDTEANTPVSLGDEVVTQTEEKAEPETTEPDLDLTEPETTAEPIKPAEAQPDDEKTDTVSEPSEEDTSVDTPTELPAEEVSSNDQPSITAEPDTTYKDSDVTPADTDTDANADPEPETSTEPEADSTPETNTEPKPEDDQLNSWQTDSGANDSSIFGATPMVTPPVTAPASAPKRKRGLLITIVVVLLLAIVGGAYAAYHFSKSSKKPAHVKVGVMMAFSGGSSSMGYGAMKGVQLAKKQLGADNIDIVQMDSKCDPKAAVDAMKRLIAQKVAAIIGEGCSSASVAALPLANNSKTVMISPSASSTTLSIPDDYFFRVVPPDTFQGQFDAQAIYDRGIRTVAVFYTNEPYGTSMNKVFQEKFEGLGGKVVATTSAQPDVIDLSDQMNQLKQANPEAIFFAPNSVVSGTAAMKVGREVGIKAPYFGADILYNTTIIDNAPTAVEGLTITSFPTGTKAFKQALLNEYGVSEQLYAAPQAYDALHAIYLATQKGASTGEAIKNILPTLSFDGVSAHIKFDQNGEISDKGYKYDLLQIKNGAFVTVDQ